MKNKIDKQLKEKFDDWCELNKNYLKVKGTFTSAVILIDKDNKVIIVMMIFRNSKEKAIMRNGLKLLALSRNLKGYFFASDTKMTMMDKKNPEKTKVYDALVQLLCSPNGSLQKMFIHDGKGKEITIPNFSQSMLETYDVNSEWDAWNKPRPNKEAEEEYYKFKKLHPELFKEVV